MPNRKISDLLENTNPTSSWLVEVANPGVANYKVTIANLLAGAGGGSPGGSNTQVQFNNSGAFAGSANFVWDNTNNRLGLGTNTPIFDAHIEGDAPSLIFHDTNGTANKKRFTFTKDDDKFYIRSTRDADTTYTAQIEFDVDMNMIVPNNLTVNGDLTLNTDLTIGTNKIQRNATNFLQWTSVGNIATWQGQDGFEIRDSGHVHLSISDNSEILQLIRTSTAVGYKLRAAASQTGNLQEWQNSVGTILSHVNADGTFDLAGLTINGNYTLPTTDGTANYVLKTDGLGNVTWQAESGGGGGGSPGGSNTHIQYNNAGAFAGSANFTWNETTRTLTHQKLASQSDAVMKFLDSSGTEQMSFEHTTNQFSLESYISTSIRLQSRDNVYIKHGPARSIYFQGASSNTFMQVSDGKGFLANDHEGIKFSGRVENVGPRAAFHFDNDAVIGSGNWLGQFSSSNGTVENFNIGAPDIQLEAFCISATQIGQVIQGAASQTGDLFQLKNSLGTVNTLFDENGSLVINESAQSVNPLRVETSSNTHALYVQNSGSRIGINTSSLSSDLNIGGGGDITLNGTVNRLSSNANALTLRSTSRIVGDTPNFRLGLATANNQLCIKSDSTTVTPVRIDQYTGAGSEIIEIFNSSGSQTMGITITGFTQAGAGNGIARYDLEHTVSPASADGDGVGINFRTENASGTMQDIAFIDALYSDISQDDVTMRFHVRNSGAPAEALSIDPDKKLLCQGDIEVESSSNGLILESPDGTRWRVTVDNTGALTTTSL